jgi:hypothetical protein
MASLADHLGELVGRPADRLSIVAESVPAIPSHVAEDRGAVHFPDSPGIRSAEANAAAKQARAKADSQYTWRPQVSFAAEYGRISPFENVSEFYNLHGNYNSASIGLQIQFPLLDKVRNSAARESTADALRAANDLAGLRSEQEQGRKKLLRSIAELDAMAELAGLEQNIAQTELNSTVIELKGKAGGPILTPKDEMNAHIQERQKYLDLLDARLQLQKAEISLLRQTGKLEKWLQSTELSSSPPQ